MNGISTIGKPLSYCPYHIGLNTYFTWYSQVTPQELYDELVALDSKITIQDVGFMAGSWWSCPKMVKHSDMTYSHDTTHIWIVYSNLLFCRYNDIRTLLSISVDDFADLRHQAFARLIPLMA